jgi:excisionase family DNA binding protein
VTLVSERLLTVEEVAQRLQVPRSWVYKHLKEIPYIKLGKYVRFEASDVAALLQGLRKRPQG